MFKSCRTYRAIIAEKEINNMTPEEFKIFAKKLIDSYTPDELFDFMDEQGAFDHLKKQTVLSLDLNTETVFATHQSEFGKTFGHCGRNTTDLSVLEKNTQLFAA